MFKSSYIKGGKSASHLSNLVNYIATRDGVEIAPTNLTAPATVPQQQLIGKLVKEYPQTKSLVELKDYETDQTIQNASQFISVAVEQNFDSIAKKKNYIDYISNRPNTEIISTHGLFTSGNDKIILSKVADEVANHKGNVWTPIISLTREDAINTGFDNAESWKNAISKLIPKFAEQYKIKLDNLQWYGSFHNESHHPHIHMVLYSVNENEGFLNEKGIENMKSALVSEIFQGEMIPIYAEQTARRNQLKKECKKVFAEIKNATDNPALQELIFRLHQKLQHTTGKKQYGYLQEPLKKLIDSIVDELAEIPSVKESYNLWYEMKNTIYHNYSENIPKPIPLSKQKEFKSIKNMILDEVLHLDLAMVSQISEESKETPTEKLKFNSNEYVNTNINLCVSRLLTSLTKLFDDSLPQDSTSHTQKIDSKLFQKLREKKQVHGQKFIGHTM